MKILWLYYDLMNLYGENGNIRCLTRRLANQGVESELLCRSLGDDLSFDDVDLLYIGAGTERSQKAALEHLRPYAQDLRAAMERGMHALLTGNAGSLLCREITDASGKVWPGLGLLDFTCHEQANTTRRTGDVIARLPDLSEPLVGFINTSEEWEDILTTQPLFKMLLGSGNHTGSELEGYRRGNFLATHLTGPVLVKNPAFHTWLLRRLLGHEPAPVSYPYEEKAWQVTLDALREQEHLEL